MPVSALELSGPLSDHASRNGQTRTVPAPGSLGTPLDGRAQGLGFNSQTALTHSLNSIDGKVLLEVSSRRRWYTRWALSIIPYELGVDASMSSSPPCCHIGGREEITRPEGFTRAIRFGAKHDRALRYSCPHLLDVELEPCGRAWRRSCAL